MKVITRARALLHVLLLMALLLSSAGPAGFAQPSARAATPPNELSYFYDEAGRLTGVVDPAAGSAAYQYDEVGNITAVTRQTATQASLIEFTPNAGPAGATVTLFGTGFSTTAGENTVKFNGVTASVTAATATELVVSVPNGATTGPIAITTPAGSATSAAPFTVTTTSAAPRITSFNPNVGTAGTTVTIDGVNFEPSIANNRVQFNGIYASVTETTATRITATVPVRAGSGRISVATPAGKALSTTDFFVPPAPYTAADIELTDRMALGENKTVALNTANKIGLILFDGTQGQQVSLKLSAVSIASSSVTILNPDGNTLTSTSVGTSGSFLDAKTLPTTGTYTILIDPSSTYTGSMTLSLYDASDLAASITPGGPAVAVTTTVPGQNARLTFNGTALIGATYFGTGGGFLDAATLPTSGVYTVLLDPSSTYVGNATLTLYDVPTDTSGTITPGGAATSISTTIPGQNATLSFTGAANQRISLLVNTATKGYDLRLLKPDGTVLLDWTYVAANSFIDTRVLPVAGSYTVVVNPRGTDTLSTSLTLYDVPADTSGTITPGGAAASISTTVPGQNATLSFTGAANQRISLLVNTASKGYDLRLLKPDGTVLLDWTYVAANSFIDTRVLPAAGSYTVVINPRNADTLSTSLTLYDVPADTSGTITPGGAAASISTTVPGQNATLSFTGTANQRISLLVNTASKGYDLRLLKPDGTVLLDWTYVAANSFIDTRVLPAAGSYTVVINPRNADTLSTSLTLYDVPADVSGALTVGAAQTVTITTPGQNARLTFNGTQGQQVSLNITGVTIASSAVSILKPDGTSLTSSTIGTGGGNFSPTLPATGTYTVVIDPSTTNVGNMTLTLSDATDVSATIVAGGPTITVTTTVAGQNARITFDGTANQRISLLVSSATKGYDLSILKPDGTALVDSTYVAANSFIDTRVLPVAGSYTIVVNPRNADLVTTGLKLYDVPADTTGTITPGVAASVTTTVPGQNAALSFTGAANQRISLLVNTATKGYDLRLLKPDGTVLLDWTYVAANSFIDTRVLPVAGSYTVVINPRNADTLSTSLTLYDVPADASGTITPGGAAASISTTVPGQNATLSFTGAANQRISLLVNTASKGYDLRLLKPDGTVLLDWTYVAANSFIDTRVLPVAGSYTVVINPRNADTLSTSLTLYDVPADVSAPILTDGATVTVTTTVPGQNATLSFTGAANQRISLLTSSATKGYDLRLLKPDGTVLLDWTYVAANSFIDTRVLPVAGSYTVVVNPRNADLVTTGLKLYDVPADASGTITPGGAAASISTTVPGQNATLSFTGAANQRISLLVNTASKGYDLRLLKPDGTVLLDWTYVAANSFIDTRVLPAAGSYTVVVNPRNADTLSTSLTLHDVPADLSPTIVAGGADVTVTTTVPGQNARLTFSGTASQRISVKLSGVTLSQSYVSVLKPDGTALIGATYISTSGGFLDAVTLPVAGTYTILVDGYNMAVGNMTVTLYDVPADVSPAIVAGGADVTVTTTIPGQNAKLSFSGANGQRISVKLSGVTLSQSYVSVLKPDGTALIGATYISTSGGFLDTKALPSAGTYTILVDGYGMAVGSITVTLYDVPADATGSLTIGGAALPLTIGTPGQNARLTFDGTASQRISLALSSVTIPASYVSILKPDGTALVGATYISTSGGTLSPTLPVAGTYTIVVDPQAANIGNMTLRLTVFGASAAGPRLAQAQTPSAQIEALRRQGTHTLAAAAQPDDEGWTPDPRNLRNWSTGRPRSSWQDLAPLQAKPGVTGLAGQVLNLKGQPLANATLEIDEHTVTTDQTGRFLFDGLEPGRHELVIDGSTANKPGRSYGLFETSVEVTAGFTNILPYTIWLTKLDTAHTVKVASPVAEDVVLTTPFIPGLEVRIPKGAVITDEDGKPVTEIGITPIPVDRPPFPLPENVHVPIYFTVQPGGAYVKPFARIIYPNYNDEPVGRQISFFHYEPEDMGWFVYGQGRVMPGGKQIVPDPGVGIYEFTGAMIGTSGNPPPDGPNPGGDDDGDPVDLSTGMFVMSKTDLTIADRLPIVLTRTYRPGDTVSRPFGLGATHPYHMFLWSARQYQEVDLIQPDGGRIHYVRISAGTGYTDAVFEHTGSGTAYHKSLVRWNGNGWDLVLKDGTTYSFPMYSPLKTIRDRHGNQITITRDGGNTGNITQIHSTNGRWLQFSYDTSSRVTEVRDNIGRTVRYQYDAGGRLWKVTDPAGGVTEYTYDTSNRMLTIKDARGLTFLTNEYDASGRVRKQTQADGTTYQFAYTLDSAGKITQTDVTDPHGSVRRVTFNDKGHTLTDTYAAGTPLAQTTRYELQPGTDLILSETDPAGRKIAYTYDAQGNVTSVTRLAETPNAITTRLTYDSRFNQASTVTDPLGHTYTFEHDARGNVTAIQDPLGRRATMTYAPDGQVATITNALNHVTRLGYSAGDLVTITDPLGRATTRFIDSAGRLVTQTNPLGQVVRYDYNALSMPIKRTDPLGAQTTWEYDANGNLLRLTDARGNSTRYTYDAMDRATTRTDPLGQIERYSYDAGGRITQATDRKGQVTSHGYDALGRHVFTGFGTTQSGGSPSYDSTITFSFTSANLVAQLVDSRSGTISYTYDTLDRLLSETTAQGTLSYSYDAASRVVSRQVAGQPAISYSYDDADRLVQMAQGSATTQFTYDDANRLIRQALPTGVSMEYAYDNASQLSGLTYKLGTTTLGNLTYGRNAAGKLTRLGGSYARTGLPQAVASASYDANNRLTHWGSRTLTYDANGNLASDGTSTYTWNTRDQLTAISGAGMSASFQYDAVGRRIGKTINGAALNFLHDGSNVVQELSGGTPRANLLTGLGVDQTYTRTDASGTQTLLTDHLGSTLALVGATGAVQTEYTYEPFGNTTASGAASSNPTQFTGRENDGTGLYYYRARYYSPTLQRFISEDPIGFASGDVNLYAYVSNSPTNFVDPSGLILDTLIDIASIGYDLYRLATDGRKNLGENLAALGLDVAGALIPFATGLGAAGRAAAHADDAADALRAASRGCSFRGDTPVSTADGPQPIDEVAVGDQVLAYDEQTGTTGSYTVTATWSHQDSDIVRLRIDGEQIETTADHPFYTEAHGWLAAAHLEVGARVRTARGSGTVQAVTFEHRAQPMYNLTVDQAHTYFVGDEEVLVHNSCPVVQVPRSKYPESAQHIEDAQAAGHPTELTIDRGGAKGNRAESMKGNPPVSGKDRDEYPPAMFAEGGSGSSVRPISPGDNRGAGSCIGHQCSAYPDGTKVRIEVVP